MNDPHLRAMRRRSCALYLAHQLEAVHKHELHERCLRTRLLMESCKTTGSLAKGTNLTHVGISLHWLFTYGACEQALGFSARLGMSIVEALDTRSTQASLNGNRDLGGGSRKRRLL